MENSAQVTSYPRTRLQAALVSTREVQGWSAGSSTGLSRAADSTWPAAILFVSFLPQIHIRLRMPLRRSLTLDNFLENFRVAYATACPLCLFLE